MTVDWDLQTSIASESTTGHSSQSQNLIEQKYNRRRKANTNQVHHEDHSPNNTNKRRLVCVENIQTSTNKSKLMQSNSIKRTLDLNSRLNIEIPSDPTLTNRNKPVDTTSTTPNTKLPVEDLSSSQPLMHIIYDTVCQNPITSLINPNELEAIWKRS